jgi:hypothetical protein
MQRYILTTVLVFGLLAPTLASAHDRSLHKGKSTDGEIVSVSADKLELKTASGPVMVTLNDKTKYEHGKQTLTKSHLKKGDHVSVFGTKLPTGELVAREILVGAPESHASHK